MGHLFPDNNLDTFTAQFLLWMYRCILIEHAGLRCIKLKRCGVVLERDYFHSMTLWFVCHSININSHPSGTQGQKNDVFIKCILPLKIIYTFALTPWVNSINITSNFPESQQIFKEPCDSLYSHKPIKELHSPGIWFSHLWQV